MYMTSLVAQMVKCLPTMQETWVQSLGWEDLLEKEMATHSSILVWKIPWTEEPDRLYSPWGHKELDTTEQLPKWLSGKELTYQCRRHKRCRFNPWVRKLPWRRTWQPTSEFLPGKSQGWRSLAG